MKLCGKCNSTKSCENFSASELANPRGWCRECRRAARREYVSRPGYHERARDYANTPERRLRIEVRKRTETAINTGRLVRPSTCQKCGKESKVETHHLSYHKPDSWKDIEFLCKECHTR